MSSDRNNHKRDHDIGPRDPRAADGPPSQANAKSSGVVDFGMFQPETRSTFTEQLHRLSKEHTRYKQQIDSKVEKLLSALSTKKSPEKVNRPSTDNFTSAEKTKDPTEKKVAMLSALDKWILDSYMFQLHKLHTKDRSGTLDKTARRELLKCLDECTSSVVNALEGKHDLPTLVQTLRNHLDNYDASEFEDTINDQKEVRESIRNNQSTRTNRARLIECDQDIEKLNARLPILRNIAKKETFTTLNELIQKMAKVFPQPAAAPEAALGGAAAGRPAPGRRGGGGGDS
jgi:hypothetical protein